jgi:hypothetical protein
MTRPRLGVRIGLCLFPELVLKYIVLFLCQARLDVDSQTSEGSRVEMRHLTQMVREHVCVPPGEVPRMEVCCQVCIESWIVGELHVVEWLKFGVMARTR